MKMPSFSSCINTSPPGENQHTGVFKGSSLIFDKVGSNKKRPLTAQVLQDEVELPPSLECVQ